MNPLKICVILPAAGSGTRTNMKPEKQFFNVLRRPVISYTISAFEELDEVTSVIVVIAKEKIELFTNIVKQFDHRKVSIAIGSNSRHKSILEGLKLSETLFANMFDVAIVHDGVRPLIQREDILPVAMAAKSYGAAGLTQPLVSTILEIDHRAHLMKRSLLRNDYVASETPQAFQYKFLRDAYEMCSEEEMEHGTECLHLIQKYVGISVKLLNGSDRLWKITHKGDLDRFDRLIRRDQLRKPTVIFHGRVDHDVAIKFKINLPELSEVSLVGYRDRSNGRLPTKACTFLFVKHKFKDFIESGINPHKCECCLLRLQSLSLEDFTKDYFVGACNLIHSVISTKSSVHRRMCIILVCEDAASASLVRATKLFDQLVNTNHDCNVSINSAIFLKRELTDQDASQFLGDLHFMSPGSCHFY